MNNYKIVLAIFMLLAGISTAKAQNVTLYQNSYSYSDGGEFTAYTSPNNLLSNYASAAIVNGGFETFCVQSTVDFYPGTNYSYVLTNTESTGQKLSLGAAYLYDQFGTGTLAGYDYVDTATRQADNGELQSAIWAFQSQTVLGGFPAVATDPYYNLAITNLGGATNAFDPNNGTFNVGIIQLYGANGAPAQAQLALISSAQTHTLLTPEPPTVLLFMFACALMALFNRRKIRNLFVLSTNNV